MVMNDENLLYQNLTNITTTVFDLNHSTTNNTSSIFYIVMKIVILVFVLLHLVYLIIMIVKINFCNKDENEKKNVRHLNDDCSICLEKCQNEAQLLCSHSFCGRCLLNHCQQNFENEKVKCPYCRNESKFIIPQFEENEENKTIYQEITKYNNKVTSMYKTSFCLCFDFLKFSFLYLHKILNFRNPAYINHRRILCGLMVVFIVFVLYPILTSRGKGGAADIFQDILLYLILILVIAESFYRRIRHQNQLIFQAQMAMALEEHYDNSINTNNFNEANFNV